VGPAVILSTIIQPRKPFRRFALMRNALAATANPTVSPTSDPRQRRQSDCSAKVANVIKIDHFFTSPPRTFGYNLAVFKDQIVSSPDRVLPN
jgi:hypothetical protein